MLSGIMASHNISPAVIYHDTQWLITEFIEGENLTLSNLAMDDKISIAMKLMTQCHQITTKPQLLSHQTVTEELINNTYYSKLQQTELLQLANRLTASLKHTKTLVCCHGDINFSNVIAGHNKINYLVDFECAFTAPVEYDLAMFIAVNNIEKDNISSLIEIYNKHSTYNVEPNLLNHYLSFCYFINGLWYVDAYYNTKLAKFKRLAIQQWQSINTLDADMLTQKNHFIHTL
jgi:thiamine kinase-like enzyme